MRVLTILFVLLAVFIAGYATGDMLRTVAESTTAAEPITDDASERAKIDSDGRRCPDGTRQQEDEYKRFDGVCEHLDDILSSSAGWSTTPTTEPGAVARSGR